MVYFLKSFQVCVPVWWLAVQQQSYGTPQHDILATINVNTVVYLLDTNLTDATMTPPV